MDLLSNLFIPETLTDIFILRFGLFFSLLLLLPYLSILIGSQLFSLVHVTKSNISKNSDYLSFAKYLSELVIDRLWIRIIFGILPFFSFAFFYSQIYSGSSENLLLGFILFLAGICSSVAYKGSFALKNVDTAIKNRIVSDTINIGGNKILRRGGWIGLAFLYISAFIVITYIQKAIIPDMNSGTSLFSIMFSTSNIIYFLLFIALSFALTSAVVVAQMNRTKEHYSFQLYSKEFTVKTGILFTFIQPILFVLNIISISNDALSFSFFISSMLIMLFMLIISVQFYNNFKNEKIRGTSIVFIFLLLFTTLIYNSQLTSEKIVNKEAVKKANLLELFS